MTPLELEILIHHLVTTAKYARRDAPAVKTAFHRFCAEEILKLRGNDDHYELTGRGRAWLERILDTPMPVCKWVFPDQDDSFKYRDLATMTETKGHLRGDAHRLDEFLVSPAPDSNPDRSAGDSVVRERAASLA